ncbi:TonB-dependent receptor [Trinickia dinghuensis]|uniref:TonB-dependent siderophore receptor n=1 Tax=Trinickia dinghuensis TaxID=2291023 RepID=A0A3D8JNN1_9BURK|nr:TonB-dependent siderophore receptor [Trinickia dinghuensis]RDU94627.1 TonB-dependent siderophore receptor [Trinickia dinghuensis]
MSAGQAAAQAVAATSSAATAAAPASASPDGALPAITVKGKAEALPGDYAPTYAGGQVARGADYGVLGKQDNLDMPFSVTSYTSQLIEDQQARTLADVVANDPAVRSAFGFGNFSQEFIVRGFPLDGDDIALNGLYGIVPRQLVMTEALERVDVFKGANSFVEGVPPSSSGVGGGIDLQLKRADDKPLTRVTFSGTASGEVGTHVDVGRRFGSRDQFGIRVNSAVGGGETSIDGEHRRDAMTSVSLDYRGDKLRLYGDFIYQRERITDGRSVVYVGGNSIPAVPSPSYNYSQAWNYSTLEDTIGMVRAEYDFLPGWTAYASAGVHHDNEGGQYESPTFVSPTSTTGYRLGVPYKADGVAGEAGVRGRFATGQVTHRISAGVSISHLNTYSAYSMSSTFPTSLYDTPQVPLPATAFAGGNLSNPGLTSTTLMRSAAIADTLGLLNDRVLLTAGARYQKLHVDDFGYTGAVSSIYDQSATTPVFGLVVKPWQHVSFYVNRTEALSQGGQAPNTARNANQVLSPYRSRQVEAGVKYDANRYGASFAMYQIDQPSAYVDPTTNIYGTNGDQRHRGIEASVYGEPIKGVRLIAGGTVIDARLRGTQGGLDDGNEPIGVPRYLFTLNGEWDIPELKGVTLMGRATYTSKQYLDAANQLSIAPWTRFDVGARYRRKVFGHETELRAMVLNVANHAYWSSALGGYLTQGAPRTVMLSLSTDF